MNPTITVRNITGSSIFLDDLGLELPAGVDVTLTDFAEVFEIQADGQLQNEVSAGNVNVSLNGGIFFTGATALNVVTPVSASTSPDDLGKTFSAFTVSTATVNSATLVAMSLDTITVTSSLYAATSGNPFVSVARDGVYIVSYRVSLGITSGTSRTNARHVLAVDRNDGSGFVVEPGYDCYSYHRQSTQGRDTGHCSQALILSTGNSLAVGSQRFSGAGTLEFIPFAGGLTLTFVQAL